jgi:hypothetical protein
MRMQLLGRQLLLGIPELAHLRMQFRRCGEAASLTPPFESRAQ